MGLLFYSSRRVQSVGLVLLDRNSVSAQLKGRLGEPVHCSALLRADG